MRTKKLQSQKKTLKGDNAVQSGSSELLEDIELTKSVQRPVFFLWALSSGHPQSVESIKELITDVYLARFDERINELQAERRPGRPKAKEQSELEEKKKEEEAEYETGLGKLASSCPAGS